MAVRDGGELPLGGNKQRALLALLCLSCGAVLSVDRIVDELWGESAPPSARHMVQVYVSKLRKLLGPNLLVTQPPGYTLDLDPERLDTKRFEALLEHGSEALARGEAELATDVLGEALALWRGEALADFSYEPFAQPEIGRLSELRRRAEEELIDAELGLGRSHELVARIETLVAEEPLRERRHGQLMRALYRAGRQADALAAYRRAREIVVEELGIEPGPELQRLEHAVLNHDEAVLGAAVRQQLEAAGDPSSARRRWLPLAIIAGIVMVFAAVALSLSALGRDDPNSTSVRASSVVVHPNSIAVIDANTAKIVGDVPVGRTPGPIDFGGGAVWVGNYEDRTVSRIRLEGLDVETVGIPVRPYGLAYGDGAVWVTQQGGRDGGSVSRLDLLSHRAAVIPLGRGDPLGDDDAPRGAPTLVSRAMPVEVHDGAVWVGRRYQTQVVKIDTSSDKISKRINGSDPADLGIAHGSMWVVDAFENAVLRVDERSGRVTARITVGEAPCCVAATNEAIWVVSGRTQVWVISPRTNSVEATIDVGEIPVAIDAGEGAVWVANYGDSSVSRIDAESYQVRTIKLDRRPVDIAAGGGRVWVSIDQ